MATKKKITRVSRKPRTKIYLGRRKGSRQVIVTVNGCPLNPRQDLHNYHSGLEWGYGGSGPAQLALAILADHIGDSDAMMLHNKFKWALIAKLPVHGWKLTSVQIDHVLENIDLLYEAALKAYRSALKKGHNLSVRTLADQVLDDCLFGVTQPRLRTKPETRVGRMEREALEFRATQLKKIK